jgi:hypothetical protein
VLDSERGGRTGQGRTGQDRGKGGLPIPYVPHVLLSIVRTEQYGQ